MWALLCILLIENRDNNIGSMKKEFYKTLISLNVPSCWAIAKNHLIQVPFDVINALDEDDLFEITEIYLSYNVFRAEYKYTGNYKVTLWVSSYPEYVENKIVDLSYDIDLYVINEGITSKKRSPIIFSKVLHIPTFELLQASLNTLMLNTYYDFNVCLNKRLFADLLQDIDPEIVQSDYNLD